MSFREKWTNFSNVTTFLDACALCCYNKETRQFIGPLFNETSLEIYTLLLQYLGWKLQEMSHKHSIFTTSKMDRQLLCQKVRQRI